MTFLSLWFLSFLLSVWLLPDGFLLGSLGLEDKHPIHPGVYFHMSGGAVRRSQPTQAHSSLRRRSKRSMITENDDAHGIFSFLFSFTDRPNLSTDSSADHLYYHLFFFFGGVFCGKGRWSIGAAARNLDFCFSFFSWMTTAATGHELCCSEQSVDIRTEGWNKRAQTEVRCGRKCYHMRLLYRYHPYLFVSFSLRLNTIPFFFCGILGEGRCWFGGTCRIRCRSGGDLPRTGLDWPEKDRPGEGGDGDGQLVACPGKISVFSPLAGMEVGWLGLL
ncbi:hypothetical protein B0H66DRAFT_129172 [Apodospora peruviana]|uniref:Secreted protein n=1 Tax=Apodospora peruviana TaxID=516989 RepID=A0AAE0III0_9PEZI|nr:hypothetical protein B0H66DRAFT_129172 [Apodospora peruviana]